MPVHRCAIRDSLITLFETPVTEDNAVGRTVLANVLGPSPIDFAKPIFNFKDNAHLSALSTPGRTPVVWESKLKVKSRTVLNQIENEGQELLSDFLGASEFFVPEVCELSHLTIFCTENMCMVDGTMSLEVPIIPPEMKLVHFNSLWCHLFHALSNSQGMNFFRIVPSKNMTISGLLDRVFPAIPSTNNQPTPFITTKTVAYIFALIIDSVTVHHSDSPHSRALQIEATILKELDSMTPADFRTQLRTALISYYDGILKLPGAAGQPEAKIIKRQFHARPAADAVPQPAAAAAAPAAAVSPPAEGAEGAQIGSRDVTPAPVPPEAAEAAAAAEPAVAPTRASPATGGKGGGGGACQTSQA